MHEPSGYAVDLICSFDLKLNKHNVYRGKDCIKKFCSNLKEFGTKIVNYVQKEMMPLTTDDVFLYESQKVCHICKRGFCYDKHNKEFKIYQKVIDHCHYTGKFRGAAYSICSLRYKIPQEIPVTINNGSKYDYQFLVKELAEEFKGGFEYLGENTEQYISFSVPI